MMTVLYIVGVILWLAIGAASFVWFWRQDHDFTVTELPLMFGASLFGPVTVFLLSMLFIMDKHGKVVLFRKKL